MSSCARLSGHANDNTKHKLWDFCCQFFSTRPDSPLMFKSCLTLLRAGNERAFENMIWFVHFTEWSHECEVEARRQSIKAVSHD